MFHVKHNSNTKSGKAYTPSRFYNNGRIKV